MLFALQPLARILVPKLIVAVQTLISADEVRTTFGQELCFEESTGPQGPVH